jgi:hypothetical protein
MKTARQLLEEFIASSFKDPQQAAARFAADGAFEMPYLADLGFTPAYRGRREIAGFFQFVRDLYPGFEFENLKVLIDTPDQVFAEYEFRATSSKTGWPIHQLFFGRLVAERGAIKLLRESVNTAAVVRAVFPDGLQGIPEGAPLADRPRVVSR